MVVHLGPRLGAGAGRVRRALTVWRSERALGWLLVPAPLLFLAFMGLQGRYFGRWLLPIFPIVCLLAAFFALQVACHRRLLGGARTRPGGQRGLAGRARCLRSRCSCSLLARASSTACTPDLVLSRADTRNLTREWMLAHIPAGAPIVVEPVSPNVWAHEPGTRGGPATLEQVPSLLSRISPDGALDPAARDVSASRTTSARCARR